jgi:tetrahydromethanopterin S-methyltransferase subunit C
LTRETTKDLTNQKLYSTVFKISQVVADPFIALAFIFSPFGIKHQNGINLGPFNPIASPKSSNKSTKAIRS